MPHGAEKKKIVPDDMCNPLVRKIRKKLEKVQKELESATVQQKRTERDYRGLLARVAECTQVCYKCKKYEMICDMVHAPTSRGVYKEWICHECCPVCRKCHSFNPDLTLRGECYPGEDDTCEMCPGNHTCDLSNHTGESTCVAWREQAGVNVFFSEKGKEDDDKFGFHTMVSGAIKESLKDIKTERR